MSKSTGSPRATAVPTRYSLLSRLQDWDDQESWRDFFDTYWRLIYTVAIKSGLNETEAQDVVQETVICVAKSIHKFKRDRSLGSFKSWLGNIIRWRVIDQKRKRRKAEHQRGELEASLELENLPAVEAEDDSLWDQEWQRNLYETALDRVKGRASEENYQAFYLNVIKKWPVRKVCERLGISPGRVYIAKHRISFLIKKEVRALEKKVF